MLSFATASVTIYAQSASISPSFTQTTFAGGSINFTATRGNNNWGSNSNSATYSYLWSISGGSYTISDSNPASVGSGGFSNQKTITFSSAGTYTVSCTVTRTSNGNTATTSSVTVNVFTPNLYSTSGTGTVKAYQVNPVTGAIINGPVDIFTPTQSTAGLGKNKANVNDPQGCLYYILNTSNNSGTVRIYAATPTGTGNTQVGSIDMNGSGDNTSLGFVRLGFDGNGKGWIIAGDGGSALYIASFQGNGTNNISNVNTFGNATLTISGGSASDFQNGDLAISAGGTLYALANITGGNTYIYTLNSLTSPSTLTKKWTVQTGGGQFTGTSVNGVAWTQTGSLHITTGNGIYFIDQTTANSAASTVQCTLISSVTGLTDLASSEFPSNSTLPVVYSSFNVKKSGSNAELVWTTENETNNDHFVVQRSTDGVHFQNIGSVTSKGNGSIQQTYNYTDAVGTYSIVYYRLQQVDVSGSSTYSSIVALRLSYNKAKIAVYPNPFASDMKLQIQSDKKEDLVVRISNMTGQVVLAKKYTLQSGDNVIVLTGVESLKAGIYSVEMITDGWKSVQRVTKQ